MNQRELIAAIAESTGESKAAVTRVLHALGETTAEAMQAGDSVSLPKLGRIDRHWRKGRIVRDIQRGRKMLVGGRQVARFRASAELRRIINSDTDQSWRDPEHQKAWRLAETLIGDLDLYHGKQAPQLDEDLSDTTVRERCAAAFGHAWNRAVQTFTTDVPDEVRQTTDYLAKSARACWS